MKSEKEIGSVSSRFWAKVQKGEGCWKWIGSRDRQGYGSFSYNGRTTKAHRLALILSGRPEPINRLALHKCDHPWCVNPEHLYWGEHADNMKDAKERGTRAGDKANHKKLSGAEVQEIRALHVPGARKAPNSTSALAAKFGVSKWTIKAIVRKEVWT